jgi:Asp/Glu/hydantoin racemase
VFTSSILQVPFAQAIIGKGKEVGIITANKASLTHEHMLACNITDESNVYVVGLEDCKEWRKIFDEPDNPFDMEAVSKEILGAVEKGFEEHPNTAIIVLECTDLPPYAQQIREKFGVPVFDINSMIGYVAMSIGQIRLYD